MTFAWEQPATGKAAEFAAVLAAVIPVIETERLVLRAPRIGDFDAWAEVFDSPAAPWIGGPFERDEAFVEFAACVGTWLLRGHGPWTVESRADEQVLGFVMISFEPGDREPELGFLFRPSAEGRGYAFEAATAALGHARALALPSLVSYIAPENVRSRKLAARLGARLDGMVEGCEVWRHFGPEGRL